MTQLELPFPELPKNPRPQIHIIEVETGMSPFDSCVPTILNRPFKTVRFLIDAEIECIWQIPSKEIDDRSIKEIILTKLNSIFNK